MSDAAVPSVTVVIAARNAADELPALFAALRAQTVPRQAFETIVVDDRSTDATAALVEAEPDVALLRAEATRGPYPARNVAARVARGDLLAFTDADCVPAPDWIATGVRAFDDPAIDHVGGEIRIPLGAHPTVSALLDAARHLDQALYARRGYGATANMWVRRAVFDAVGGFNDRLLSGGDRDFGNRAVAAGHRLRYAPEVIVEHPPRSRPRDIARKGYRIGIGSAQAVAHAEGELGAQKPVWRNPWTYVPPRRLEGRHRLAAVGHDPDAVTTARILLAQYLLLTVPVVAGSMVGSWRVRRPGR